MASSLGRKKLVCFYCGRRSSLKQDGSIREWECLSCEAVNYLDENGEITDPPVATTLEAPMTVQFAQALPRSPSSLDDALFCDDCLKNQHLFTSSLAQYIPEDENTLYDRKYYKFRSNLEKRYPQVCSDCEAGVLERIKQAGYTARTDHLRRLMDKTRSNHTTKSKTSWTQFFQTWGGVAWWLGLGGQVAWDIFAVFMTIRPQLSAHCDSGHENLEFSAFDELAELQVAPPSITYATEIACWAWTSSLRYLDKSGISVLTLAKWSLVLSVFSIWWNPQYRHMVRGFDSQIKGFGEWYTYQVILVLIRILFRLLASTEMFNDPGASINLGAHTFMLVLISILAVSAQKSIKTDITPLFAPTPERLRPYVRHKPKSNQTDLSMALNDIAEENSQLSDSLGTQNLDFDLSSARSSPTGARYNDISQNHGQRRFPGGLTLPGLKDAPLLSAMTPDESHQYMSVGKIPERLQYRHVEEMEWDPAPSNVFNIARPPQTLPILRNSQSPQSASDASPFWFKVPPAPVGPAHRLRNPPNQPRFQSRTEEAKQNFFDTMKGASYGERLQHATANPNRSHRQEMDVAQQKFFPPINSNDSVLNGLSEMFDTVRLKAESEIGAPSDVRDAMKIAAPRPYLHVAMSAFLICCFIGWGYTYVYYPLLICHVDLAVLVVSGAVALRSLVDCTINTWANPTSSPQSALYATISGIEAAVAGHGIFDVLVHRSQHDRYHSQMTIPLLCVMLVHELWLLVL